MKRLLKVARLKSTKQVPLASYLLWCSSGSNQGGMATPRPAEAMASGDIEANQTRREFCNLSFCMSSVLCNILEDWKVCGEVWIWDAQVLGRFAETNFKTSECKFNATTTSSWPPFTDNEAVYHMRDIHCKGHDCLAQTQHLSPRP